MAFRFLAVLALVFVLAICSVMEGSLASGGWFGSSHVKVAAPEYPTRKMLVVSENVFKGFRPLDGDGGGKMVGWDLRTAPSGPDPLHHNRSPKKPRSP